MLKEEQKRVVRALVNDSLDKAEEHWNNAGEQLITASKSMGFTEAMESRSESEPSKIPGHEIVQDGETVIDEFVAFVADMRGSSRRLVCATSHRNSDVSGLQRVYYETSALLPALAQTVKFKSGNTTEYLGDGVLALFQVDPNDKMKAVYAAHAAAKNAIGDTRSIVNNILKSRYRLPGLDLGVGLAMSKSLVTLIGLEGEKHPKAFGECVFRATKLSGGTNRIIIDKNTRAIWPSERGGTLRFEPKQLSGVDGYLLCQND